MTAGEGGGDLHLPGPGHLGAGRGGASRSWPPPTASTGCWSGTRRRGTRSGGPGGVELPEHDGALGVIRLHLFHLLQTVSPQHRGPGRRGAGPGPARRGVPRARVLGRAVRAAAAQPAAAGRWPGRCCATAPGGCPAARRAARGAGLARGDVPVAVRQRRPRGEPAAAPQPAVRPVAARTTSLQRHIGVAVAYNVWQYYQATGDARLPVRPRRRDAAGGRPVLGRPGDLRPGHRPLRRSAGVVGPDEFHDRLPGRPGAGAGRQRLHQRDGGLGAARGPWRCWTPLPPRRADGAAGDAGPARRRDLERWQDVTRRMRVPFHDDGVISQFDGYERAGGAGLGRLPRPVRRHPAAGPHPGGRGRLRRTGTRRPSRPTC